MQPVPNGGLKSAQRRRLFSFFLFGLLANHALAQTTTPPTIPAWTPKTPEDFLARGFTCFSAYDYTRALADAETALTMRSDWPLALFLDGRAAFEARDYATAIHDFDQASRLQPDWAFPYLRRGEAYAASGQKQRAIDDYEKFIALAQLSVEEGYYDLGRAYLESGDSSKAKINLDKAIERAPALVKAREQRALLFEKVGDRTAKLHEVAIILGIQPNNRLAWRIKERDEEALAPKQPQTADAAAATSGDVRHPEVMPQLRSKVEPKYSEEARLAGVRGEVLLDLRVNRQGAPEDIQVVRGVGFGLDEEAIQSVAQWRFDPAKDQGVAVSTRVKISVTFNIFLDNGQPSSLKFTLPSESSRPVLISGKVPENPKGTTNSDRLKIALSVAEDGRTQDVSIVDSASSEWAQLALREVSQWRFRPAVAIGQPIAVKGILELNPDFSTPDGEATKNDPRPSGAPAPAWQPNRIDDFLARGYSNLHQRLPSLALADAEAALHLDPACLMALYLHGIASLELHNDSASVADFTKVIQQRSSWAEAYLYRGLAYDHSDQREKAVTDYQKAIDLNRYWPRAYSDLGNAYREMGQFDLAKMNLDKAIELEPDYLTARENRAKLFAKQGDTSAERKELILILGLKPSHQWAKKTYEEMQSAPRPQSAAENRVK